MDDPDYFEVEDEDQDTGDVPEDHDRDDSREDPDYQLHPCDYQSDSDAEGEDVTNKLSRTAKNALMDTPFPQKGETYDNHLYQMDLMLKDLKKMEGAHNRHFGPKNTTQDTMERALEHSPGHQMENDNFYYGTGTQHPF
jgi:hypothetical protein